ncbi:MAG: hypothetical protein AAGD08_21205 [Pseudomonadota bacterium]
MSANPYSGCSDVFLVPSLPLAEITGYDHDNRDDPSFEVVARIDAPADPWWKLWRHLCAYPRVLAAGPVRAATLAALHAAGPRLVGSLAGAAWRGLRRGGRGLGPAARPPNQLENPTNPMTQKAEDS